MDFWPCNSTGLRWSEITKKGRRAMQKHAFTLSGDGATAVTDTGKQAATGKIEQVRWIPDTQDTGPGPSASTITLFVLSNGMTDTGRAVIVYNEGSLVLGNDVIRAPRIPDYHTNAVTPTDTGTKRDGAKVCTAGDLLKVKVLPADTGAYSGKFYVYVD